MILEHFRFVIERLPSPGLQKWFERGWSLYSAHRLANGGWEVDVCREVER
jgi:hypothetical protein